VRIVWTPLAEQRAAAFVESMRADRTGAAWRWLQGMLARVRGLSRNPERGESSGELFFAPCRVIYRIGPDRIVILTLQPVACHRKSARYEEPPRGARHAARARS
jgi:plasmid stabilization system protein ParE